MKQRGIRIISFTAERSETEQHDSVSQLDEINKNGVIFVYLHIACKMLILRRRFPRDSLGFGF